MVEECEAVPEIEVGWNTHVKFLAMVFYVGLGFFPCRVLVQLYAHKNYMYPYLSVLEIAFKIDILVLLDWIAEMQGKRYFYRIFI